MELLNMAWNAVATASGSTVRRNLWLRRWPGIAAGGMLLALLVAFQFVLRGSVVSGESRRQAFAANSQELKRCADVAPRAALEACRRQFEAPSGVASTPSPEPAARNLSLLR